jgi:hypothetical protein
MPIIPDREPIEKSSTEHALTPAEALPLLVRRVLPIYSVDVPEHPKSTPSFPSSHPTDKAEPEEGEADRSDGLVAPFRLIPQTLTIGNSRLPDRSIATLPNFNVFDDRFRLRIAHSLLTAEADDRNKVVVNFAFRISIKKLDEARKKADPIDYIARTIKARLRKLSPDYLFVIESLESIKGEDLENPEIAHIHGSFIVPRSAIDHVIDPIMFNHVGPAPLDGWKNTDIEINIRNNGRFKQELEKALSEHFLPLLTTREDGYSAKFRPLAVFAITNYNRSRYAQYSTKEKGCAVYVSGQLKKRTRDAYNRLKATYQVEVVHGIYWRGMALMAALSAVFAISPPRDYAGVLLCRQSDHRRAFTYDPGESFRSRQNREGNQSR